MTSAVTDVRTALYAALTASEAVTALLPHPEAVYHQRAPRDADFPFVVFHKQAGTPINTFRDALRNELWLVKGVCEGESATDAEQLDAAIDSTLDSAHLDIAGREHLYLARESDVDYPAEDHGETHHHVGGLYRCISQPV